MTATIVADRIDVGDHVYYFGERVEVLHVVQHPLSWTRHKRITLTVRTPAGLRLPIILQANERLEIA